MSFKSKLCQFSDNIITTYKCDNHTISIKLTYNQAYHIVSNLYLIKKNEHVMQDLYNTSECGEDDAIVGYINYCDKVFMIELGGMRLTLDQKDAITFIKQVKSIYYQCC